MKKTKTKKAGQKLGQKLGFSLLELSIALTIIAVLISAIAAGGQMMQKAKIAGAQSLTKSSPVNRISNLLVWYETTSASSFKSTEVEASSIATWYNLNPSINSNNATAGTNPTYVENTINGLPVLQFNGSSQYLNFDGTSIANSNYTAIVVEERLSSGSNNYFISGNGSGTTNRRLHLGYRTDTQVTIAQYANDYNITIAGYSNPTPRIHVFRFSSALGKNYYLNGTLQTLVATGSPVATQGLIEYASAQIARSGTTLYYYGNIGEIIIFNKYINDDEMNDIELYLSKKWGIVVS